MVKGNRSIEFKLFNGTKEEGEYKIIPESSLTEFINNIMKSNDNVTKAHITNFKSVPLTIAGYNNGKKFYGYTMFQFLPRS